MKKALRVLLIVLFVVLVVMAAGLIYLKMVLPNVAAAAEIKIDQTPARVARGEYLANHVTVCMDCHSKRDFSFFSGPPAPGTAGMGGDRFDQTVGLPGVFYSGNITPEGLGRYTDGELVRVITTGVTKEGKAMFPLMPYPYYGHLDTEDVYSIVSYLRTLKPVKNDVPASKADFPVSLIINTIPTEATPVTRPDPADVLAYGKYLTNAAACRECHSKADNGQVIAATAFAGGREFRFPDGSIVRSSNLTSDATGLGKWTAEQFVARFKIYADSTYTLPAIEPGEFNSIMPWTMYSGMTRQDLTAVYTYLKTISPVENSVEKFSAR